MASLGLSFINKAPIEQVMRNWKSVTVRMKDDDVASLNQRLAQAGYKTLGEMVRAFTQGILGNNQLVEPLAEEIADRIVVKMSTMRGQGLSSEINTPSNETARGPVVQRYERPPCTRENLRGPKVGGPIPPRSTFRIPSTA